MGQRHTEDHIWGPEKKRRSPADSGNDRKCCHMAAAVRSVKRGKFRLAARHTRMAARTIAVRVA